MRDACDTFQTHITLSSHSNYKGYITGLYATQLHEIIKHSIMRKLIGKLVIAYDQDSNHCTKLGKPNKHHEHLNYTRKTACSNICKEDETTCPLHLDRLSFHIACFM